LTKSFVVSIKGNSKSNHLGAQGTFSPYKGAQVTHTHITNLHTDIDTHTTNTQTNIDTDKHRHTCSQTNTDIDTRIHTQTKSQINKDIDQHRYRHTRTHRQTHRQANTHKQTQTHTDILAHTSRRTCGRKHHRHGFQVNLRWWRGVAAVLAVCAVGRVCCRFGRGDVLGGKHILIIA